MSPRLFQLSSVGLLIFSLILHWDFRLWWGNISDMWRETDRFIHVEHLLPQVLKPSIRVTTTQILPSSMLVFMSYSILMGGNDSHHWCTVGSPVWNSISFLDHGTSVWWVVEVKSSQLTSPIIIMKSSWQSCKHLEESDIYKSIVGSHPGVTNTNPIMVCSLLIAVPSLLTLSTCTLWTTTKMLQPFIIHSYSPWIIPFANMSLSQLLLELLKGLCAAMQGHGDIPIHNGLAKFSW